MRLKFNIAKFLLGIFAVVAAIVAVYQLYSYFYVAASTEYATVIECEDTVKATGYFLRDESVITASNSKYIDITVKSGDKVARQGRIANVYSDETAAKNQSVIRELESRAEEIRAAMSSSAAFSEGKAYVEDIRKSMLGVSGNVMRANVSDAFENAADFTASVIKNKISSGEITDYSDTLSELERQIEEMKITSGSVVNYITAPKSGYYVSKTDGLESSLSLSAADELTSDSFAQISACCESSGTVPQGTIGKLVDGSTWRACFKSDSPKFERLSAGDAVYIRMPSVTDAKIKCEISQIFSDGQFTYVVLQSNMVSGDILSQRCCEIDVITATYRGLRVDKNALRKLDGEDGVYVERNGLIKYCKVEVIYIGSTYAVVKYDPLSGLQAFDEVVIKGVNLYDGKVVS